MRDPARRYEALLRIYPEEYRSVRGQEMLTTLLEAGDHRRLRPSEYVYLLAHAARVWIRRFVRGPRGRPLPQPVRFVYWVLIALTTWNWLTAIVDSLGHQLHHETAPGPVVAGFVFFGLIVLIQSRRRFLYGVALAVIASFVVSIVVQAHGSVGSVAAVPYTVLLLLLVVGWRPYGATVAAVRASVEVRQRDVVLGGDAGPGSAP